MAAARLLLLLPFLVTALVPKGYMPDVRADGGFTVTLCTTEGLRTVTLDANGAEIPPGSDEDSPRKRPPAIASLPVSVRLLRLTGCLSFSCRKRSPANRFLTLQRSGLPARRAAATLPAHRRSTRDLSEPYLNSF